MKHPKAEITKSEFDEYRLEVEAGWPMEDGSPLYTFSLRNDGCLEVSCAWTDPVERMHICNPVELHRLLGEVLEIARKDGDFELASYPDNNRTPSGESGADTRT